MAGRDFVEVLCVLDHENLHQQTFVHQALPAQTDRPDSLTTYRGLFSLLDVHFWQGRVLTPLFLCVQDGLSGSVMTQRQAVKLDEMIASY